MTFLALVLNSPMGLDVIFQLIDPQRKHAFRRLDFFKQGFGGFIDADIRRLRG